jgi:hypothetical protein
MPPPARLYIYNDRRRRTINAARLSVSALPQRVPSTTLLVLAEKSEARGRLDARPRRAGGGAQGAVDAGGGPRPRQLHHRAWGGPLGQPRTRSW